MASSNALDLVPIQARTEAATPGPWDYLQSPGYKGGHPFHYVLGSGDVEDETGIPLEWSAEGKVYRRRTRQCEQDGSFIAHAREDIPALIAEVERLRTKANRMHEVIQKAQEQINTLTNQRNAALTQSKAMRVLLGDVAQLHTRESYETPNHKRATVLYHGEIDVQWVRDQAKVLLGQTSAGAA